MIKIEVITKSNFRTDVLVDGMFMYESFLHRAKEIENLKKLVHSLCLEGIAEVVERERR